MAAQFPAGSQDLFVIQRTATDYLPATLQAYLALPPQYAATKVVADGKTVKLLLDGIQGAEIKFPFSPVTFEFGSYARANNDTADTTWDNLKIETAGGASFAPATVSVRVGEISPSVTLKIPQGLNSQAAVQVKVVSSDPTIAIPEGGTAGSLTVTFPQGGANTAIAGFFCAN